MLPLNVAQALSRRRKKSLQRTMTTTSSRRNCPKRHCANQHHPQFHCQDQVVGTQQTYRLLFVHVDANDQAVRSFFSNVQEVKMFALMMCFQIVARVTKYAKNVANYLGVDRHFIAHLSKLKQQLYFKRLN
jgi:hypothetical protein